MFVGRFNLPKSKEGRKVDRERNSLWGGSLSARTVL